MQNALPATQHSSLHAFWQNVALGREILRESCMLRRVLFASLLSQSLLAVAVAEEAIPIEQEPRHRMKFANEHVRFFDVELEPGYESRYHWHRSDGVFVSISSSPTIAQDMGKEPVQRGERAIGETYFIDYGTHPKAHRVTNSGSTPYHVIDTEILKGCGATGPLSEGPNQTLLIDNPRVIVTRLILHPGESTELYAPCGMLVAVSAGTVSLQMQAGIESVNLQPAGFRWRQQNDTVKLTNTGNFVFHGVDIRLK
ncbi:MAG: hypothetical protein ACJ8G2_03955 [Burkholderiales bacterium]|jgi:hypothetical protein